MYYSFVFLYKHDHLSALYNGNLSGDQVENVRQNKHNIYKDIKSRRNRYIRRIVIKLLIYRMFKSHQFYRRNLTTSINIAYSKGIRKQYNQQHFNNAHMKYLDPRSIRNFVINALQCFKAAVKVQSLNQLVFVKLSAPILAQCH